MIRAPFDYSAPCSIDEAMRILADAEGAKVIGGGTVLIPSMGLGEIAPKHLVDTRNLPLGGIRVDGRDLVIGAAASYNTVSSSPDVATHVPLLKFVCDQITGGPQITRQATIGGSACLANPASDAPACLLALKARLVVGSLQGRRSVAASDFFAGPFETVLRPGEMLLEIVIPGDHAWSRYAYIKQKHCTSSWPIATASCLIDPEGSARVSIGAASGRPYAFELHRNSGEGDVAFAQRAGAVASSTLVDVWEDTLAPALYRRRIVGPVAARVVRLALEGETR